MIKTERLSNQYIIMASYQNVMVHRVSGPAFIFCEFIFCELTRDVLAQQEADRVIRLPGQPDRGNIQAVCSHG
jgi:hypothetical protein